MKYLCLAYEEEQKLNSLSKAEWHILRQETLDYVTTLRESGQLIDARPLRSATTASMVRVRDGKLQVTDGPFAETKEQLGGFFLIEAADREEAIRIASNWPSARIGSIEVRPIDDELQIDRRYSETAADLQPALSKPPCLTRHGRISPYQIPTARRTFPSTKRRGCRDPRTWIEALATWPSYR